MQHKTVVKDILVVGGGGAGIMSAIIAAREGASVAMVLRGKVGKSGNYIMLGGSFGIDGPSAREYCNEPDANLEYTKEGLFDRLVTSAFEIGDQKLQKHFVDEGPKALKEFFQWAEDSKHKFLFNNKSCRWRTSGTTFGNALKKGLKDQNEETEIDTYEDTIITDLLTSDDGKVCGALGIEVNTGELIEFRAKAVILATGGYQPHSLKNTCTDMTGSGIAMALEAGAEIKDMEFLLYIPTLIEPLYAKGSILPFQMTMPTLFPLKQKATDLDGVELVYPTDKYKVTASSSKVEKLLMHFFYGIGMYEKWDKYGNQLYFDYSEYTDDEIKEAFETVANNMKHWYKKGSYHHIDLAALAKHIIDNDKRMLIGMGNEYSMGGVVVDEDFATKVPGLYAAGEVTAGLFGAFRSADGLTEMLAHGLTAGKTAYEYIKDAQQLEPKDLNAKMERLIAPLNRNEGISPIETLNKLESICDIGFNFFRDGERLSKAYDEMKVLISSLDQMVAPGGSKYNLELINSIGVRHLAICAEVGLYSALNRKETRGCHVRSDYPEVNNKEYQFSFVASLENGQLVYSKSYPEATYKELDTINYTNLAECIRKTTLEVEQ